MIVLKTESQINTMNKANTIVHMALREAKLNLSPGISTQKINDIIEKVIYDNNGKPTFNGYMGFPKSSCISINNEVVHGIPSDNVIISDGDVVSIDVGVTFNNFVGDSAITIVIGDTTTRIKNLIKHTHYALYQGIKSAVVGNRLHDVSDAIDQVAKQYNYGNVRNYCGHGIGKELHEEPQVFNYINKLQHNVRLRHGMTIAIEPMFTLGKSKTKVLDDGWAVVASDIAAHWELSIAIMDSGPKILGEIL